MRHPDFNPSGAGRFDRGQCFGAEIPYGDHAGGGDFARAAVLRDLTLRFYHLPYCPAGDVGGAFCFWDAGNAAETVLKDSYQLVALPPLAKLARPKHWSLVQPAIFLAKGGEHVEEDR
ncbi:hypothetical protein GWE18_41515 [Bradyrhizobium sp. CSA112]|nr:hypothetical protein [Bradyrhizobium sp. CSA112]